MRQTVKNRMIKSVQLTAVGVMAMASIMGTAASMGMKMDNIPFNVLAHPFQAVMTQGVAATQVDSGSCGNSATYVLDSDGTLTISGTGAINRSAFQNYTNIKKVIINEGITEIGESVFNGCQSLTSINIPDSVTQIGDGAFQRCLQLKSIHIPNSVTQIGEQAFAQCQSLESIAIPDGVNQIGGYTFQGCESLTSIDIPDSVTQIGDGAFYSCSSLKSINIPNDVTQIGESTFQYCQSLTSVILSDSLTQIGNEAFRECQILESINISNGVTQIGDQAFRDCESLTSVILSDSLNQIGNKAFQNCQSLTSVILSDSLTQIGDQAFAGCESLTSINIPDSVTCINQQVFDNCNNLTLIQGMKNVTSIESRAFCVYQPYDINNPLETTLETDNEYVLGYNWLYNQNRKINAPETPECGPDATYKEDDTKVTITGTGAIDDEAFKDNDTVTEVVIEEGITEIGNQSFENMDNLETVIIPDSVTNIGDKAFAENPNLEIVQGGDNATIADNAFDCVTPNKVIKVDSEKVYNNIKDNTNRTPQLANNVPISPVDENWLYSSDDKAFITDKVQIGSVADDFESLLDKFATVVGLDEKQGAKQTYEAADANSEDTTVYCTKASDWIITIPKDLVMSGDDESKAEYVVGVYGNVDPAKRVTVTPDASFNMINTGNSDVKYTAQVNQPVTGINGIDIAFTPAEDTEGQSRMDGSITANLKRAGSYRGTMTFTVDYVDHT